MDCGHISTIFFPTFSSHFNSILPIIFRAVPSWQRGSLRATLTKCNARSVNYHCPRERRHNHDYYYWRVQTLFLDSLLPLGLYKLHLSFYIFLCSCICGECFTLLGVIDWIVSYHIFSFQFPWWQPSLNKCCWLNQVKVCICQNSILYLFVFSHFLIWISPACWHSRCCRPEVFAVGIDFGLSFGEAANDIGSNSMFAVLTNLFAHRTRTKNRFNLLKRNSENISTSSVWLFEQGIGLSVTFRLEQRSSGGECRKIKRFLAVKWKF